MEIPFSARTFGGHFEIVKLAVFRMEATHFEW